MGIRKGTKEIREVEMVVEDSVLAAANSRREEDEDAEEEDEDASDDEYDDDCVDDRHHHGGSDYHDDQTYGKGHEPEDSRGTTTNDNDRTLYIGNVEYSLTDDMLADVFGKYGVQSVKMIRDHAGRSKGYAFIVFDDKEGAEDALLKMHGVDVGGRKIYVNKVRPKEHDDRRFDSTRTPRQSSYRGNASFSEDNFCSKCGQPLRRSGYGNSRQDGRFIPRRQYGNHNKTGGTQNE